MVSDTFQLLWDQHRLRVPKLQTLQSRLQPSTNLCTLLLIPVSKKQYHAVKGTDLMRGLQADDVSLTWSSALRWPRDAVALCWPWTCCWASVPPAVRADSPEQDSKQTVRDASPHPVPDGACAGALPVFPSGPVQRTRTYENKAGLYCWICTCWEWVMDPGECSEQFDAPWGATAEPEHSLN